MSISGYDPIMYESLVKNIGSMSSLYSASNSPLLHPRFVEKLFCISSGAFDLSRRDISFDAKMLDGAGVGVKTFVAASKASGKSEKVAEFTKYASNGLFQGKTSEELAFIVSEFRNSRVTSDSQEYGIALDKSFYHCLVRVAGAAFVHEEPYSLIDVGSLAPTDSRGHEISNFNESNSGHIHFTDRRNFYIFNISKNVLYKKFKLDKFWNSKVMDIAIDDQIISRHLENLNQQAQEEENQALVVDRNSVILPLYSIVGGVKFVSEKSGINQWNAGGRARKFGEAYIPIPRLIHRSWPDFFPARDAKFELFLPTGESVIAKVCQDGSKALMSDPNTALCDWLYRVIDGSSMESQRRYLRGEPYTYSDLQKVGKDAVRIIKLDAEKRRYRLETCDLGSYETQNDELND